LDVLEILCRAKLGCVIVCLLNDHFLKFDFKGFFHYITHSIGPLPSLGPWFVTLHLWSTFGPYRDPPSLLCPWMASHDAMQDDFVSITKDVIFHVLREQTHVLPSPTLQFTH